jgi:hypothetical protein
VGDTAAENVLNAVTATSARSAWAVGEVITGNASQTFVLHWNGTRWRRVPSPNPGGTANNNALTAVAIRSPANAWAVGVFSTGQGTASQALAVHCC